MWQRAAPPRESRPWVWAKRPCFSYPFLSIPPNFRGPIFAKRTSWPYTPMYGSGRMGTTAVIQRWTALFINHNEPIWVTFVTRKQFWWVVQHCTRAALPCPWRDVFPAQQPALNYLLPVVCTILLGGVHPSSHPPANGAPCSNICSNESGICSLCFILMKLCVPVRCDFHLRCNAAIQTSLLPPQLYSTHWGTAVELGSQSNHLQHVEYALNVSLVGSLGTGVQARKFISKGPGWYGQREGSLDTTLLFMCLKWMSFLWAIYPRLFYNMSASWSADSLLWGCANEIKD